MRRKHRWFLVAAAVAAGIAGGQLAFATTSNDVFTDVPSSAADHDAINRVYQAGIMNPCSTSPMKFCPNDTTLRRGVARQYDYVLGLSGTPGNFTPTFDGMKLVTSPSPPMTVNSSARVVNLNADRVDGLHAASVEPQASAWGTSDPPPPYFGLAIANVTVDHPSRLLVLGTGRLSLSCSISFPYCEPYVGLYVDGVEIPGSGYPIPPGSFETVATQGLSGVVAAGSHQVALAAGSFNGYLYSGSLDTNLVSVMSVSANGG